MKIYVLSHSYECDVEKTKDEGRFLGVYLTKKEAIEKAEMYKKIKGFSSHLDGFYIDKIEIDQLSWTDGYRIGYFSMELGMHEEREEE